jgi:hemerythrin
VRKPPVKRRFLATSEAAALLGVSVATLKRWAQAGLVGFERTEGGHRRFLRADLEAFARPPGAGDGVIAARADELLSATVPEIQAVLLRGRLAAGSWWAWGDQLRPCVIELHRRRHSGRITAVEWLSALDRLRSALTRFRDGAFTPPDAPSVLVCSAPGDRTLQTPVLAELVAAELGWAARPGGQPWPAEIPAELARQRADALLVTASDDVGPDAVARLARELGEVARAAAIPLGLAGLGAWPEPTAAGVRLHSFAEARAWLDGLRTTGVARPAPQASTGPAPDPTTWDRSLLLGDPTIDAQHRALFGTAGAFIQAVRSGAAHPEVERLLGFVHDYTAVHFRFEENLMRAAGYPLLDEHVWEHEQFIRRLGAQGPDGAPDALADLLASWLAQHVRGSDQRFGEYLRQGKGAT